MVKGYKEISTYTTTNHCTKEALIWWAMRTAPIRPYLAGKALIWLAGDRGEKPIRLSSFSATIIQQFVPIFFSATLCHDWPMTSVCFATSCASRARSIRTPQIARQFVLQFPNVPVPHRNAVRNLDVKMEAHKLLINRHRENSGRHRDERSDENMYIREVHIFKSCSNSSIFELICGS